MRWVSLGVSLLAAASVTLPAESRADDAHTCARAAYDGQRLRDEGKLVRARARLLECASPSCPAVIVSDCSRWLADVETRAPSVILAARDGTGHDLLHVVVTLDGQPLTDTLDGRPIPTDAGPHTFGFTAPGAAPVEESVVMREGERARVISVTLRAAPAPATSMSSAPASSTLSTAPTARHDDERRPDPAPPLWPAFAVAGVSVVTLGGAVVFGLSGQSEKNRLADTCAPTGSCSRSDVGAAREKLIAADVFLGVSIVTLAAAAYLFVRRATLTAHDPPRRAAARAPR